MNLKTAAAALALTVAATGLATAPASASTDSGLGVTAKSYSRKQVAAHNKASDCWTIVNGRVYNLTRYVAKHPGGRSRIVRICGKDGTSAFRGQHGSSGKPNRTLAAYRIGTVR